MRLREYANLPQHIGVIPDGNRRWAKSRGLPRHAGYDYGLAPALELVKSATELGIEEMTFYGFTQDNTKRAGTRVSLVARNFRNSRARWRGGIRR